MKITIIPDFHGRPFWRDAVKDVADTPIVFLGDYLDLWRKRLEVLIISPGRVDPKSCFRKPLGMN